MLRRAEEQLSERCTFKPNTGREMRVLTQSGAIQSARSHYGGSSTRLHHDTTNIKVQNAVPLDSKRSLGRAQAIEPILLFDT